MKLSKTPRGNRLHIGIFGKRNSGKSSLINALTDQNFAIVSPVAGTTTDPVYKAMEFHPIGPVVFIDTAGFDDTGELGKLRVEKTRDAVDKTDIAIFLCTDSDLEEDKLWFHSCFAKKNTPVIWVLNKIDNIENPEEHQNRIREIVGVEPIMTSITLKIGIDRIKEAIVSNVPEGFEKNSITGNLAKSGDTVLLVMPQNIQAPKGRLILPQVQTLRDLLDKDCITICSTADNLPQALSSMKMPPDLIITDSQCFDDVYKLKPAESLLTSFSVLFAALKGDINSYINGASAIDNLTKDSKVLIAEACTHAPLEEDIGRVKIPALLRKKYGEALQIHVVAGADFPKDLSEYDLIIHCGACMFNRSYVLSRIDSAKQQNIPITNYGIAMAKLTGILDKISY